MTSYGGGNMMKEYGYKRGTVSGRRDRQHRFVAERALGRRLKSCEYVHHINEDGSDNRLRAAATGAIMVVLLLSRVNLAGYALLEGTASGGILALQSTSHATKGAIDIGGNLDHDNTTNANQFGLVTKGGARFIHNFNYGNNGTVTTEGGNTIVGENAGNLTMGGTASQAYHSSHNTFMGTNAGYSNTTGY